jgi:hypothetical protein
MQPALAPSTASIKSEYDMSQFKMQVVASLADPDRTNHWS